MRAGADAGRVSQQCPVLSNALVQLGASSVRGRGLLVHQKAPESGTAAFPRSIFGRSDPSSSTYLAMPRRPMSIIWQVILVDALRAGGWPPGRHGGPIPGIRPPASDPIALPPAEITLRTRGGQELYIFSVPGCPVPCLTSGRHPASVTDRWALLGGFSSRTPAQDIGTDKPVQGVLFREGSKNVPFFSHRQRQVFHHRSAR